MNENPKLTDYSQPTPLVSKTLADATPGRVLDTGAGQGRNSLYLARLDWEVVAMDKDEAALDELRQTAEKERLNITTELADIREFSPSAPFNVILSLMVLHFLSEKDFPAVIKKMQGWTKPGGLNLVSGFTTDNSTGTRPYQFKPNGLREFYNNWKIVEYEESWSSYVLPPGETVPQRYMAARLIAQRPF